MLSEIKTFLQDLGMGANQLGHEIYIVGGFVRNLIYDDLYNTNKSQGYTDIDLVINTNAIDFIHKFQKYYQDHHPQHLTFEILEQFDQFGTIKIKHPEYHNYTLELASTRTESYEEAAAFPKVTIIDDIKKDLPRRDFTINALLVSLNKEDFGEIIDHVGGIKDMQKRLIRVFHDQSFIDDPTRIYRAVRFAAEYDFEIEEHTLQLMRAALANPNYPQWFKKRKNRFEIELAKGSAILGSGLFNSRLHKIMLDA